MAVNPGRPLDIRALRNPKAQGTGFVSPMTQQSVAEGKSAPQAVLTIPAPWLELPPDGSYFQATLKSAAVAAGTTLASAVTFTLPAEADGVLAEMQIFIDAPTILTDIDWILKINGGPVQGWSMTTFPRAANNFSAAQSGSVLIPTQGKVTVDITNNGAGPFNVGTKILGWYWPRQGSASKWVGVY